MSAATFTIKMPPRRMLSLSEAAIYVGIPAKRFPSACRIVPIAMPDGKKQYDIRDLDEWLDSLKAGSRDTDDDIIGKLA